MTPASEDEEDGTHMAQDILWQTVRGMKWGEGGGGSTGLVKNPRLQTYHYTMDTGNDDENTGNAVLKAVKPPIFVYGVTSLSEMQKTLNEFLDEEQYTTKSMANDTIKLTCQTPDTYRTLAIYMRDNNIIHHTCQPKKECSNQVVIKHLHHSVMCKT